MACSSANLSLFNIAGFWISIKFPSSTVDVLSNNLYYFETRIGLQGDTSLVVTVGLKLRVSVMIAITFVILEQHEREF